jgi:molecular chaperone GrpE
MTDNDPKEKAAAAERLEAEADAILAAAAGGSAWAKAGEGAVPDAPVDAAAEIARLEAEKADLTDRLVRLAAEMDNLRKRTERELQDARKYAVTKFAGDMLVVGDNLKRALEAVPAEKMADDEALKALVEGVQVTGREMERLLEKNGITRIAAIGERFDPHRHQAMFEVPDATVPPGTVTQVVQEGYQIGDRVLRAALVGIAKGGPAAAETASDRSESAAD